MKYAINTYNCSSFCVASSMSCVDMLSGMSAQLSMASLLRLIPQIFSSLFLQWHCCDNQCAIYSSGQSLHNIHIFIGVFAVGCTAVTAIVFLHLSAINGLAKQ